MCSHLYTQLSLPAISLVNRSFSFILNHVRSSKYKVTSRDILKKEAKQVTSKERYTCTHLDQHPVDTLHLLFDG